MKTYAPKTLIGAQFRAMLQELDATPKSVAKFLRISERTAWRYLADDSAPYAVLALIWHETGAGRHASSLDSLNELNLLRAQVRALESFTQQQELRIARLLALADSGASNDALRPARDLGALLPQRTKR